MSSSGLIPPGTQADLAGVASNANGKRIAVNAFTDSFDNKGVSSQGPSMPSGKTIEAQLVGKDPVWHQLVGVFGVSDNQGVMGLTSSNSGTGVYGGNMDAGGGCGVRGETVDGVAVQGHSFGLPGGNSRAGKFIGVVEVDGTILVNNVQVSGSLTADKVTANLVTANMDVVLGADCAEEFDVVDAQQLEPGTVVVIDQEGALRESRDAYDKKVAGIVSGAGGYRPGIVLDRRTADVSRTVVALVGKVYCKVDAQYGPIEMGDLLTPSPTPGHAMKASDPGRAFGSVIGKALRPLQEGRGMVPVLVALQ